MPGHILCMFTHMMDLPALEGLYLHFWNSFGAFDHKQQVLFRVDRQPKTVKELGISSKYEYMNLAKRGKLCI